MAGQFGLRFWLPHKSKGYFTCCKSATLDYSSLSEGRHAVDFFTPKIRWLRLGLNPQSWVPEASMLTTRPLKLLVGIKYRTYFYLIFAFVFITQVISSFQILYLNMAISTLLYCALGMLHLHVLRCLLCHVMSCFWWKYVFWWFLQIKCISLIKQYFIQLIARLQAHNSNTTFIILN
jgi:hypothetical protein